MALCCSCCIYGYMYTRVKPKRLKVPGTLRLIITDRVITIKTLRCHKRMEDEKKAVVSLPEALTYLTDHQQQVNKWLSIVNAKIFELETSYLQDETSNVVRGWDTDGRPPVHRTRAIEDKERLFSYSSYGFFMSKKEEEQELQLARAGSLKQSKKQKRRKVENNEDWNAPEDY